MLTTELYNRLRSTVVQDEESQFILLYEFHFYESTNYAHKLFVKKNIPAK